MQFRETHIFPNSNKIAIKLRIKILFDFLLNPQYFFILGKSFYSLSHILIIEIIEDKINKFKWSYFRNLREWKIYYAHDLHLYLLELVKSSNIPNFEFGMLYTRTSLHIIFYCILVDPRNSTQLKDPRRELGVRYFHIWVFSNFEKTIVWF